MTTTREILLRAKNAARSASALTSEIKNTALLEMADALETNAERILRENEGDMYEAKSIFGEVMLDRLRLTPARIKGIADGIRQVAALPDPIGETLDSYTAESGIFIRRVRVPIGVVGIIYESRPNVTADAGALCFKSGNACVLRGGKEAFRSSYAIVEILRETLARVGVDENFINIVEDTSRNSANEMMTAVGLLDALIPRGGANMIKACVENAKVPCIQTGTGLCHIFIDESADIDMALDIVHNAKTSRPSVCNAAEVCLVHEDIAPRFLPLLEKTLRKDRAKQGLPPVELRCDERALAFVKDGGLAGERDFDTEFLDYILAVKVVSNTNEAIAHIADHSTGHSEAIVTQNTLNAEKFTLGVDSAAVYVNASTRFTDGGEFGLGCEIGISTQKLHARGPMGLKELCSYKYIVSGNGNIR